MREEYFITVRAAPWACREPCLFADYYPWFLVPLQSGFDKLYGAHMGTSIGIFPRGDLRAKIIVKGYYVS